jgi:hypothetical protein
LLNALDWYLFLREGDKISCEFDKYFNQFFKYVHAPYARDYENLEISIPQRVIKKWKEMGLSVNDALHVIHDSHDKC